MLKLPTGEFEYWEYAYVSSVPETLRKLAKKRPVVGADSMGSFTVWFQDGQYKARLSRWRVVEDEVSAKTKEELRPWLEKAFRFQRGEK